MNADPSAGSGHGGSGQTRLTNNPDYDGDPSWSPDGTRIVFISNRDGYHPGVCVMNADSSGVTCLTSGWGPSWSPDGRRIAFTSYRDGNWEIYVMNADGSEQTNLTNNPAVDSSPSWSPDGTRIAFSSNRDDPDPQNCGRSGQPECNREIYVMNADGSEQTNLTNHPAADESPSWAPDGTRIAFGSNRDGNWEIYVMNADPSAGSGHGGSGVTRLTDNPAYDGAPVWGP